MSFPVLYTKRLLLRQINDADQIHIFKGLSHPDVIRYYGVHFDSYEDTAVQMRWYRSLEETHTGIWWALCASDNSVFYGAAGLNNWHRDHQKSELGFWLLPVYKGRGLMQEALIKICSYAHETLGIHRLEAFVESENEGSRRLLERLGFDPEGTMRDCEIKHGRYISLDIYAHLAQVSPG